MADQLPQQKDQLEQSEDQPKALQIAISKEQDQIAIDRGAIDQLFGNAEVKNAPICIYSIAGPLKNGKSFFMSLVTRYLEHKSENKDGDWRDDTESELNKGFEWKGGVDGYTQGIYIWSKPFWLRSKTSEKVAVFLMDTQGLFDKQASARSDSLLFTLSTYLCSYQIYNLKSIINTNDLEKLQMFSQFHKRLCENDDWKLRQPLLFLLRDWQDKTYQFGHEGGEKFLQENNDKSLNDYKAMYVDIKNTFDKTECALIPHPGFDISERSDDAEPAKLRDVREIFLKVCDATFEIMFENPVVKKMNEQPLTGTDIANLAYTISNLIEKKQTFGVDVMLAANASSNLQRVISLCETNFFKFIKGQVKETYRTADELKKIHQLAVDKAMKLFDEERKIGKPNDIKQYRNSLFKSLKQRLFMFQCYNEVLGADVKEKHCRMFETCVENHIKSFPDGLTIMDEKQKQKIFEKKLEALAMYKPPASQQRRLELTIWDGYRNKLEHIIDAETKMYLVKNNLCEVKFDIHLRKKVVGALNRFMTEVEKRENDYSDIPAETIGVGDFKVGLTSLIFITNNLKFKTYLFEVKKVYEERSNIKKAIATGDVEPLTFARVQKIVATHGEIYGDSMPQTLLDEVLQQIPQNKQSSLLTTVADMCNNEWKLQHFKFKLEKENEEIAILEAQVSAVNCVITKPKSLLEGINLLEKARNLFKDKVQSISDKSFITQREESMEKMLTTIQETWKVEHCLCEERINDHEEQIQKRIVWSCCQEMSEHLHGIAAKEDFMTKMKQRMKSEFTKKCKNTAQNDAVHAKNIQSFQLAIEALMGDWEKVNKFHMQIFSRMTGWGAFVRNVKHFVKQTRFYEFFHYVKNPDEMLLLAFSHNWKVGHMALNYK